MNQAAFAPSPKEGTVLVVVPGFKMCDPGAFDGPEYLCVSLWQLTLATQGKFGLKELIGSSRVRSALFYNIAGPTAKKMAFFRRFLQSLGIRQITKISRPLRLAKDLGLSGSSHWGEMLDYGNRHYAPIEIQNGKGEEKIVKSKTLVVGCAPGLFPEARDRPDFNFADDLTDIDVEKLTADVSLVLLSDATHRADRMDFDQLSGGRKFVIRPFSSPAELENLMRELIAQPAASNGHIADKPPACILVVGVNSSAVDPVVYKDPKYLCVGLADSVRLKEVPQGIQLVVLVAKDLPKDMLERFYGMARRVGAKSYTILGGTGNFNNSYRSGELQKQFDRLTGAVAAEAPQEKESERILPHRPEAGSDKADEKRFASEPDAVTNTEDLASERQHPRNLHEGDAHTEGEEKAMTEMNLKDFVDSQWKKIGDDSGEMIKAAIKYFGSTRTEGSIKTGVYGRMKLLRQGKVEGKVAAAPADDKATKSEGKPKRKYTRRKKGQAASTPPSAAAESVEELVNGGVQLIAQGLALLEKAAPKLRAFQKFSEALEALKSSE